jgi:hypothetical protein
MRHVRCTPDGTKVPRTGHPDPWRARSGEILRACPACRAWGRARTCPASRRKLVDLESRGVSQRGAIQIHPLIRLACDSWQRRDQQLSIRRGSVRSSVLVWNAAAPIANWRNGRRVSRGDQILPTGSSNVASRIPSAHSFGPLIERALAQAIVINPIAAAALAEPRRDWVRRYYRRSWRRPR